MVINREVILDNIDQFRQNINDFIQTIPKAQLLVFTFIIVIIITISFYGYFQNSYSFPSNTIQFLKKSPLDCRTLFNYNGTGNNFIQSRDVNMNINNGEITLGVWLYISGMDNNVLDDLPSGLGKSWFSNNYGKWKHVLHFGSDIMSGSGGDISDILFQAPGMWLNPEVNNLTFRFNTEGDSNPVQYTLNNIPMNRWFQITIAINNNNISIYKNGKLEINKWVLNPVLMRNNYKLFIGRSSDNINNGFAGLMYLGFYSKKAMKPPQISYLVKKQREKVINYYEGKMRRKILSSD